MDTKIDGRRARGDLTRKRAAICAAEIATVSGLDSISMSQLSEGTGLSKSGILTVFENREAIQLAAVEEARTIFTENVVSPAWHLKPGALRLRGFIENWFNYVETKVFPGGCFLAVTASEYGAQHGDVADAVRDFKATWIQLIEGELWVGQRSSGRAKKRIHTTAFHLDSLMVGGNTMFQLFKDADDFAMAQAACLQILNSNS